MKDGNCYNVKWTIVEVRGKEVKSSIHELSLLKKKKTKKAHEHKI
jgi:hypothetical protein